MKKIENLDDVSKDLISTIQSMEAGKTSYRELNAKRGAYAVVVKIAELKIDVLLSMGQKADLKLLAF